MASSTTTASSTRTSKTHGLTPPASTAPSTEREKELSAIVDNYLVAQGFFEDEREAIEREKVLGLLNNLVNKFIKKIANKNGIPTEANKSVSRIFTSGSYRLGVHARGADIDVLCVVPNFIRRKDFFTLFYDDLSSLSFITDLTKIEEAYVPLIKFKIHSIPIDFLFARLDLPVVPPNINLLDNSLLKHMEEKCILSLNGNRVTDEILTLVPDTKTFHSALRFIKYWAQKRFVYGNSYGYMGGVAYALCVGRVCQMYPNASSFTVIAKFFSTYAKWNWPQPVLLKEIVDCNYNLKVWNPNVNNSDRQHKMPVITPAYPSMCSTHNVSTSSLTMMKREFQRGASISETIEKGEKGEGAERTEELLDQLCGAPKFFEKHKNYFMVAVTASDNEDFKTFSKFVESKIRLFSLRLENVENVSFSFLFPLEFDYTFAADQLKMVAAKFISEMDLAKMEEGAHTLRCFFLGLELSSTKLPLNASKKLNLGRPVAEFKQILDQFEAAEGECYYEIRPLKKSMAKEILGIIDPAGSIVGQEPAGPPPVRENAPEGAESRKRKLSSLAPPSKKIS